MMKVISVEELKVCPVVGGRFHLLYSRGSTTSSNKDGCVVYETGLIV